jgi:hypothetical protein
MKESGTDSILVTIARCVETEPGTGSIFPDVRFFYYPARAGL